MSEIDDRPAGPAATDDDTSNQPGDETREKTGSHKGGLFIALAMLLGLGLLVALNMG